MSAPTKSISKTSGTAISESADASASALDRLLFYEILLGELNAQDGEPGAAYSLLLDAARRSNDSRLFKRTVEVALRARQGESALQAAQAWQKALPNSREANSFILQVLVGLNRLGETAEPLKRELAATPPGDRPALIATIPRFFARATDKKLALSVTEQVLADYFKPAEVGAASWTTLGRLRFDAGDMDGALDAAQKGHELAPKAEGPALLALALLNGKEMRAEKIVKEYLAGTPRFEVRMDYARVLMDAQRYPESAAQFKLITVEKPDYSPPWLALGLLQVQDDQVDKGELSLKRYLELATGPRLGPSDPDETQARGLTQAYLLLAQIAEQRKDFVQAEKWLAKIENSEELVRAQMRRASMLAKQGKVSQGRTLLEGLPERTPEESRAKLSAMVQFLRENKENRKAYDLLTDALKRDPKDFDLMYDQAMLADKLGQPDEMERLLRNVITAKPDFQHAYNALGYSLADRNVRLPEAKKLIQKALELSPGDPFISDSLAWAEFRMGNKTEAQRILQIAFKQKPDAEIAAHLGEVLWSLGKKDEAVSVWREGMQINPENDTLVETLKRLRVQL